MKRILVTGAAGELGRDLGPWLARRYAVRLTDLRPMQTGLEFVQADLCDASAVADLVHGMEAIVHLAVLLPMDRPGAAFVRANVEATINLLEAAVQAGVRRFVYTSTVWATGHGTQEGVVPVDEEAPARPVEMYGLTKLQGELAVEFFHRQHGLEAITLRQCGYSRLPGFDAEGRVVAGQLDLKAVAERLVGFGVKLFDPGHLGRAYQLALDRPLEGYTRVIVGAAAPLEQTDAPAMATDPLRVWDRLYPGARAMLTALGVTVPRLSAFYSTRRAQRLLGWRHEYDLGWLIGQWRASRGGQA